MTKDYQLLPGAEEKNTPILKVPSRVRMPDVPIDCQRVNQAINYYQWDSAINQHLWVHKDDLIVIGKYLIRWRTEPYWEIILQGGVRGYSLLLHELTELDWYFKQDANPFNAREQTAMFRESHAEALLHEHRFLQVVAKSMGYSVSFRELVVYNPHGDPPKDDWVGDWEVVLTQKEQELSRADKTSHPDGEEKVREFYKRLGFKNLSENS